MRKQITIKRHPLAFATLLTFSCAYGQSAQTRLIEPTTTTKGKIWNIENSCGYDNRLSNTEVNIGLPYDREVDIIKKILSYTGLPLNFQIFSANIRNAAALIVEEDRIILYDPALFKVIDNTSKTYWTSISILAHEIGHHLSGHTLKAGSNHFQKELEADKFSGFVLYKMGASLEQAITAMTLFGDVSDTKTHPNKTKRIEAIKTGWNEASGFRYSGAVPPPPSDNLHEVYSPEMFFDNKHEKTVEYKEMKDRIYNPNIYSGVILEVDEKYDGHPSGELTTAILVLVEKSEIASNNLGTADFEESEKVWIIYNYPIIGRCTMAEYRNFSALMKPGRKITFSAIWEGGNSVGHYQLNHIATVPIKK